MGAFSSRGYTPIQVVPGAVCAKLLLLYFSQVLHSIKRRITDFLPLARLLCLCSIVLSVQVLTLKYRILSKQ